MNEVYQEAGREFSKHSSSLVNIENQFDTEWMNTRVSPA